MAKRDEWMQNHEFNEPEAVEKLDKLTGDDSTVTFTVSADAAELPASVTKFVD